MLNSENGSATINNPESHRNIQLADNTDTNVYYLKKTDINDLLINDFSIIMKYPQLMEAFAHNLLLTQI